MPLVLLPIVPHLTTELTDDDAAKRLDALRLLCRLFSHREGGGRSLAADFGDVLGELLGRARDKEVTAAVAGCVFFVGGGCVLCVASTCVCVGFASLVAARLGRLCVCVVGSLGGGGSNSLSGSVRSEGV